MIKKCEEKLVEKKDFIHQFIESQENKFSYYDEIDNFLMRLLAGHDQTSNTEILKKFDHLSLYYLYHFIWKKLK